MDWIEDVINNHNCFPSNNMCSLEKRWHQIGTKIKMTGIQLGKQHRLTDWQHYIISQFYYLTHSKYFSFWASDLTVHESWCHRLETFLPWIVNAPYTSASIISTWLLFLFFSPFLSTSYLIWSLHHRIDCFCTPLHFAYDVALQLWPVFIADVFVYSIIPLAAHHSDIFRSNYYLQAWKTIRLENNWRDTFVGFSTREYWGQSFLCLMQWSNYCKKIIAIFCLGTERTLCECFHIYNIMIQYRIITYFQ